MGSAGWEVNQLPDPNCPSKSSPLGARCPRCQEKLSPHAMEGFALQVCTLCGGLWIGLEEFKEALKKRPPESLGNHQQRGDTALALWEEGKLACPLCGLSMSKGRYAYSSDVIIDRCEHCGGIWLDRGELARLRAFVHRPVPEDRLLMAQMEAQALKKKAQARELSQARATGAGASLGEILRILKEIFS